MTSETKTATSVDPTEVNRFSRLAAEWWNPHGKFRPLHKFNPVRLRYIRRVVLAHFARDGAINRPFDGLTILDIGCGGGLLSEPMARLGATVTGIDPSATNIEVARLHAATSDLAIDYRATTAEEVEAAGARFDVLLCMEVVEHVADVPAFLATCAALVKPGGLLLIATINRTMKAFALAIVGAEYVLGWLPKGTHQYDKLVRPEEIEAPLAHAGLAVIDSVGVAYNLLTDTWFETPDTDVNYMMLAQRPPA
jgi:2-polyprenyl-6-hydroxyphenyl methylase/3-demethylubiquinone-9 3-methyltransferase